MALVQVTLDVTDDILKGLATGALSIAGGVVRDRKGIIRKHLPTIADTAKSSVAQIAENHKGIIIGLGIAVTAVVVGGVIVIVKNAKKASAMPDVSESVEQFRTAMQLYLQATKDGQLDENTLDDLIVALEELKNGNEIGTITIDFTAEQLNLLVNQIFDFTIRFADANAVEIKNITAPECTSKDNLINLQQYLELQKQIFESVS